MPLKSDLPQGKVDLLILKIALSTVMLSRKDLNKCPAARCKSRTSQERSEVGRKAFRSSTDMFDRLMESEIMGWGEALR
jgi:hypothetical protein